MKKFIKKVERDLLSLKGFLGGYTILAIFSFFVLIIQESCFYIHLFNVQAMWNCLNNILIEVSFTIGSKRCFDN